MKKNTTSTVITGVAITSLIMLPSLAITVLRNDAVPEFPSQIQFLLSAQGEAQIESVELEFGTDALSCGQSVSRALPEDFTPGASIETDWTWNLRRTGPMPPGTNVWWRWILRDSNHNVVETPVQSLQFTDTLYPWKAVETDTLVVYWYFGDNNFAQSLMDAGEQALEDLQEMTGVQLQGQIRVYVYATSEEMQSSTLFAPDWSGGLAFSEHSAVLTAIDPSQLDWGRRVVSHELAHVVIGHYTFSCIESLPIWLNEGLAVNAEGQPTEYYTELLQYAIEEDSLQSVRELGEIFSNDPSRASLAYAQSSSLVLFLFNQYGQEKILSLLDAFRDGTPEDQALMSVIGMDRDGLETAWRESVGAAPMKATPFVGPTPTRTPYPTFAPITGPEFAPSETPSLEKWVQIEPSPIVTPTLANTEEQVSPLTGTVLILVLSGAGIALASLITWLIFRQSRNR